MDWYDDLKPVYMVASDKSQKVHGCWRLLPTTGPYMLKDTFSSLLRDEVAPEDPHVWEISRLAIMPTSQNDRRQAHFGDVTLRMMQEVVDHAMSHGIHSYVVVTSVVMERMLESIGVGMRRFGDGKVRKLGKVFSVACWIHINQQTREAVFAPQRRTGRLQVAA